MDAMRCRRINDGRSSRSVRLQTILHICHARPSLSAKLVEMFESTRTKCRTEEQIFNGMSLGKKRY